MTDTPQLLLTHHLKALRLPTFLRAYDKVAKQCAAEGIDQCCVVAPRRTGTDRPGTPHGGTADQSRKVPGTQSLDSFDFKAMPSLHKMLVMELARCD
jgi:hypothetical protein